MNPNTTAWNRVRYGLYAPFYDLVARRLDRGRKRSIELLALQPEDRLLIVGAGTGLDFPHLPSGLDVTAVDLSPAMLAKAQARAAELDVDADVRVMNAQALDLPDAHFDAVLLHLILAVVPDPRATIREVARVLRPGGKVGIFDKFLPDDGKPSLLRRTVGAVTNALFSDINRRLGPLLREGGLVTMHEEPSLFSGTFKVVVAAQPVHHETRDPRCAT